MRFLQDYNRREAVAYAHRWAYGRNPAYYDYEHLGGDCTNFASQCIYAGCGIMNFTPTFGWYYIDANNNFYYARTASAIAPTNWYKLTGTEVDARA